MKSNTYLTTLLLLFFFICKSYSQQKQLPATLAQDLHPVKKANRLFLTTDKTIYVPNEHIWFSGYVLDIDAVDTLLHSMYILLADRYTKKVLTSARFIMINGLSTGRLLIPGNIPDGNYALVAYTDQYLRGKPEIIFSKNISLRSTRESAFTFLPLEAPPAASKDTINLKYFVTTPHKGIAKGVKVNYLIYGDSTLQQKGTQKTNNSGEIYISMPISKDSTIKNWELVLNISEDTLSKTEIFSLSDKFAYSSNKQFLNSLQQDSLSISVSTDSANYHPRSKVVVKLKCLDAHNRPVQGIFSLSCVLFKRSTDHKDIRDYYYTDSLKYRILSSSKKTNDVSGLVSYNDRKIKKPVNVLLLGGVNQTNIIPTDSAGNFLITEDMLLGESSLMLSVAGKSPEGYSVQLTEPDQQANQELAVTYFPVEFKPSSPANEDALTDQEKNLWKNTLKTVVVKARSFDNYFYGADSCGNWVCSCGHWKCDGCPPRQKPVKGHSYLDKQTGRSFSYDKATGCPESMIRPYVKKVQPLTLPGVFPVFDRTSRGKELTTTLYWAPFVKTDEKGEAELVFYTNDLTGLFKCTVQGITDKGGAIASSRFSVKD